ncbi:HET-domain-containing protein [Dichomitus squalens]|nr:HET-domain-containing protein [Dichomitus squalens]
MRLLDTRTGQFVERDPGKTTYAILSHTWRQREQTYDELKSVQARYGGPSRTGYTSRPSSPSSHSPSDLTQTSSPIWDDDGLSRKIRDARRVAREAGYRYLWIDSCCIDKASSSELSESINSMYQWYGGAKVCYAHLADVPSGEDPRAVESAFRKSRWFTRGWTLQELIAPFSVTFLSEDWTEIGTKVALADLVEEITGIFEDALLHAKSLDKFSVAQRLSWAAKRETTRVEDQAYSLLGIFDINMATLYGEGERAFRRLQEEIARCIPDQSLFAWGVVHQGPNMHEQSATDGEEYPSLLRCQPSESSLLFSSSVNRFEIDSKDIAVVSPVILRQFGRSDLLSTEYTPTPHGIRTRLPVLPLSRLYPQIELTFPRDIPESQWYVVILGCEHKDSPGCLLGRLCYIPPSETGIDFLHPGHVLLYPRPSRSSYRPGLFPLSPATIERCRNDIKVKTVYISHPERATAQSENARLQPHESIRLLLPKATRNALHAQGYMAKLQGPDEGHPTTHWLTLSHDDCTISIEYRHTLEEGRLLRIEADVKMSRHALESSEEAKADSSSVEWSDYRPWCLSLDAKVAFTLPGKKTTVDVGLDWAAPSHYFIRIETFDETRETTPAVLLEGEQEAE